MDVKVSEQDQSPARLGDEVVFCKHAIIDYDDCSVYLEAPVYWWDADSDSKWYAVCEKCHQEFIVTGKAHLEGSYTVIWNGGELIQ